MINNMDLIYKPSYFFHPFHNTLPNIYLFPKLIISMLKASSRGER